MEACRTLVGRRPGEAAGRRQDPAAPADRRRSARAPRRAWCSPCWPTRSPRRSPAPPSAGSSWSPTTPAAAAVVARAGRAHGPRRARRRPEPGARARRPRPRAPPPSPRSPPTCRRCAPQELTAALAAAGGAPARRFVADAARHRDDAAHRRRRRRSTRASGRGPPRAHRGRGRRRADRGLAGSGAATSTPPRTSVPRWPSAPGPRTAASSGACRRQRLTEPRAPAFTWVRHDDGVPPEQLDHGVDARSSCPPTAS